jgi:hypothetical protein
MGDNDEVFLRRGRPVAVPQYRLDKRRDTVRDQTWLISRDRLEADSRCIGSLADIVQRLSLGEPELPSGFARVAPLALAKRFLLSFTCELRVKTCE